MQYGAGAAAAGNVRRACAGWRAYDGGMHKHSVVAPLHPDARQHCASFEHAVREHLEHVLHSSHFDGSARSRDFLRFVVDEALSGRGAKLCQGAIAVAVFGRRGDFDAVVDPIVRVQAGRLRRSLERYYLLAENRDPVRIELLKGSYAPTFVPDPGAVDTAVNLVRRAAATDWATLVLHPFEIRTGSQDDVTAARITDELACELHRHGEVRVVRQHDMERLDLRPASSGRFELRGRVRREAEDCRIGVRLVDRTNGEQVWSDEYQTGPGHASDALDDIARIIAARIGAEQGVIVHVLARENHARSAAVPDAASAILRCHHFFLSRQVSELAPALQALQQVTAREPSIAAAWICLARLHLMNQSCELSDAAAPIDQAIDSASRAVLLDPASAPARCVLAAALLVKGELQAALSELEQVLLFNSRSLAYREIVGWLMALAGDWERGMALMRDAAQRNPYCLPRIKHGLWANYLRRDEFASAYGAAIECRDPGFFWHELMIASSLGLLGRMSDARSSAAELLRAKPQFPQRGRVLIEYYIKPPELRERILAGLRNAGLILS